jgi:oligopeptide transport system substrate-binding protein
MGRILLILGVLAALCAGSLFWTLGDHRPADFTFVSRGEVRSLDPGRMTWLEDIRIGYGLWEGLYTFTPGSLQPIPGAASRIELSSDHRTYSFHLRPEGRWSNGDDVVAGDFVFAWRRMLEQPGGYSYLFDLIEGARDYRTAYAQGGRPSFDTVGIQATAALLLQVRLRAPTAYFPDLCAFTPFWPLHERSMAPFKDGATGSYCGEFTRPPHLVSNGPYRLTQWEYRRGLRLEANPHYWDRANVKSQVIEMLPADDSTWAYLKYQSKAADWLPDAAGAIGAELYAARRSDLHVYPALGTYYYTLNCRPKLPGGRDNPLVDVRVRQALSLAIEREPIVQSITRMGERTAQHYIPPGVFEGYASPAVALPEAAAAQALLEQAGYPQGRGFPSLSLLFNSEFQHGEIAQIVCRQWRQKLGINIRPEGIDVKMFQQRLRQGDFDLARTTWYGDYNDPTTFLDKYRSDASNNQAGWQSRKFDALLDAAMAETDAPRRMALLSQAEAVLLQEQPILPLYHAVNVTLFREDVQGLSLNPRNLTLLKHVRAQRR